MRLFLALTFTLLSSTLWSQDSSKLLKQVNTRIDDLQRMFQNDLSPVKMDPQVKKLLTRFVTTGTDSIQKVVSNESETTYEERLMALEAHGKFLDAFKYAITTEAFEVYHIRDMRAKYLLIFDDIRHHRPYDEIVNTLGPKRCKLVATAFAAYPEGPRLRDMTIIRTAQTTPERIPGWLSQNPDYHFTDSLLMIWANRAPENMARYIKSGVNPVVQEKIKACPNPLVQTIVKIAPERFAKNYLPFAIQIALGEMDFSAIDKLRLDPKAYFQAQVDIEMKNIEKQIDGKQIYYGIPTRAFLKESAVKFYVNTMNFRHEEAKESVRYAELNELRPQDIYMVIVYGEDNFYTSSYLYTYHKLMESYKKFGNDSLMHFMKYYQARKFIQLAGRYNTLSQFISNMPRDTMLNGIKRLAYGLEKNTENGLEEAMTVAETFPSMVRDSSLRDFMREQLTTNYNRCVSEPNFFGQKLYKLLMQIYGSVEAEYAGKTDHFSKELAAYLELRHPTLRAPDGTIYQRVFFYGDEDGKSSFQSFLTNFRDKSQWEMDQNKNWITIRSLKGFPTVIYANQPLDNERYDLDKDAMDSLSHFLDSLKIEPHILIHRGHSYHLSNSLSYVDPLIKLAILGSCGGYQEIFTVQQKSADAQVISTKQVGSKLVNEPLLSKINQRILREQDIKWVELWNELDAQLKKDKKAYAYFVDYIPPHKNIGLLVSKVYHDDGDLEP